ncbi:hypothetical protein KP509_31G010800 [Ceratopteris richardii]|uniref:Large ribosomal subunit protein bL17c n=2 Tax=Ceratopteris richardii TaxID=49495 RepID=A0A8T2QXB0_CERRI|nr:hypothetical protein KP509_31G010800 [Ceratopteris richardii]
MIMATCSSKSAGISCWSMASLRASLPTHRISLSSHRRVRIAPQQAFCGLHQHNLLKLTADSSVSSFGVSNGARVFAMRHGKRVPKLNRPPDQRRALLRGLTTELLRHGRIKTTQSRAKAMRKHVDHMITLAKGGSLHQRRQALGYLYDKNIVHALFAEVPDRYGERNGGYTRIIRTMPRRGDNAPMAFIELV